MRRIAAAASVILLVVALFHWQGGTRRSGDDRAATADGSRVEPGTTGARAGVGNIGPRMGGERAAAAYSLETDFPIVAPLNAAGSTIARDLATLQAVFHAWLSNFPREGNPVGENAEITAALTGDNRLGLALLPKDHPAINARGELCDRWGTPFRFHQLSGTQMEIASAGPDRKFATPDDVALSP